jgi:nucleotide-binding universal stress UspA family protein
MNNPNVPVRLKLENVLLATDFSDSARAAVGYAATIAIHYGGKVYVTHVVPPEAYLFAPPGTIPDVEEGLKRWTEQQMKALLTSQLLHAVPHEGLLKYGEIWGALAEVVEQQHIHLIVAGTRGRRGLKKLIMGSVAEEIFRLSTVPVLTVRPDAAQTSPHQFRTLLYPTDFSAASIGALPYALSFGQEFQSRVIFLHVAPSSISEGRSRMTESFIEQFRQIIPPETSAWCDQKSLVEFGDPAEVILEVANEQKVDLIVMGVRGTGSLTRASTHIGSTAYRVVSDARAPVMSVRQTA